VTREQVYGRRPVREALRGRRQVLEVWATERAVAAESWLEEAPRLQIKPDRELSDVRRLSGWLAEREGRIWLERGCPEHGMISTLYDESAVVEELTGEGAATVAKS